jgi:hypothetical protein
MWLVDTFDDFKQYLQMFKDAEIIGNFNSLVFKKKTEPLAVYYGLFDGDDLVAYCWFVKFTSQHDMLHVFETRIREDLQKRGIAMFLYRYVLLEDMRTIVSDYSHSVISGIIWEKMSSMPEICVGLYNRITDTIEWGIFDKGLVYGNSHMHLVAKPKTIQDIDVDCASEVDTNVVINTCKKFKHKTIHKPTSNRYLSRAKPFSLEI